MKFSSSFKLNHIFQRLYRTSGQANGYLVLYARRNRTATNRVGLLSDLMTQLSNMKINISEMNARQHDDGHCDQYLTITVTDREHLEFVLNRLMRVNAVSEVKRIVAGG